MKLLIVFGVHTSDYVWLRHSFYPAGRFCKESELCGITPAFYFPSDFTSHFDAVKKVFPPSDTKVLLRGEIPPQVYTLLESAGYKHTPSRSAKTLADDKQAMYEFFKANGFCCPQTLYGTKDSFEYEYLAQKLGTPFIAKPRFGSLGRCVTLVDSGTKLQSLPDCDWVFQIFIDTACGTDCPRDVRIFAVGGMVAAVVERVGQKGGIVSNVHQGGMCATKEVPVYVITTALSAIKRAGLLYGTADFLYDGKTYYLCEINASPGFEGVEKLGFNIAKTIIQCLQ